MQAQDYAYLYDLEENFWWFVGMREITRRLLDQVCVPGMVRRALDAGWVGSDAVVLGRCDAVTQGRLSLGDRLWGRVHGRRLAGPGQSGG